MNRGDFVENDGYDFGLVLQKLRKEKGWTQEHLANLIHKESSIISRYEKGLQNPTFDTVRAFAAIFNVSMDYLSGTEKYTSVSTFGLDENQRDILQNLADQLRAKNNAKKLLTEEQFALLGKILSELIK